MSAVLCLSLRDRISGGGAFIDFGSGGGEALTSIAMHTDKSLVPKLFGIDKNPRALSVARNAAANKGLGERIDYTEGSIVDPLALRTLREKLSGGGHFEKTVASVNALLHDIGKRAAHQFLNLFAATFPGTPLIITEIPRISREALQAHPDYSAAAFQAMHHASGQELFTEQELEGLVQSCGFKIVSRQSHASMPGVTAEGERWNTAVSWIVQA